MFHEKAIFTGTSPIGAPQITLNFGATLPENCIWLEGAEVSRTTYSTLFGIYGTTYGEGNGSTTFNLPDMRNRVMWGSDTAGYIDAGLPNISASGKVAELAGSQSMLRSFTGALRASNASSGGGHQAAEQNDSFSQAFTFDASRSNSIYGKSSTVQPPAIKVRVYTRYQ